MVKESTNYSGTLDEPKMMLDIIKKMVLELTYQTSGKQDFELV
jgi:hypothetical protein